MRFETRRGRVAAIHFHFGRKAADAAAFGFGHRFQLHVTALQHVHYLRIERRAGFGLHDLHRFVQRQRAPVLPIGRQRVQTIHHCQNPRADRNIFTLNAGRIAFAVPAFVMRPHDRYDGIRKLHLLQNLRAHGRMDLHLLELFGRQLTRLRDNVLRHRQLADVVEQRRRHQRILFLFAQLQIAPKLSCIHLHARQMAVGGLILGFNRQRQRPYGPQVQRRNILGMALLIVQA